MKNDKYFGKLADDYSIDLLTFCVELKKQLVLLEKASKDVDFKATAALAKSLKKLRKMFELSEILLALEFYLPDLFDRLMLPQQPADVPTGTTKEDFLHCSKERAEEMMTRPETQLFLYDLVLMKLIDDGDNASAMDFGDFIFARL